jgi:hypothetical protein
MGDDVAVDGPSVASVPVRNEDRQRDRAERQRCKIPTIVHILPSPGAQVDVGAEGGERARDGDQEHAGASGTREEAAPVSQHGEADEEHGRRQHDDGHRPSRSHGRKRRFEVELRLRPYQPSAGRVYHPAALP